jgi:hypothetical protein
MSGDGAAVNGNLPPENADATSWPIFTDAILA